jgi:hypothetical protein
MKGIGIFLIIAAIATLILPFLGVQMRLFMWIDAWGMPSGLGIRGGMVVLGILCLWLTKDEGTSADI